MPEYLAPAVYVEEVDTGAKPIEGVSTSTTGMLGVAERGPLDVPILITSQGEYRRWFGQALDPAYFGDHCYLPHAVEGFFTNGGKRVYVTRVVDTALAAASRFTLFYDGAPGAAATVLLRASAEFTGSAANPPPLVALSGNNLNVNDWVRIGDGSASEYRQATAITAETVVVPLHLPFARAHDNGASLRQFVLPAAPSAQFNLTRAVQPAASTLDIEGATADINALAGGHLLRIDGANGEYRFVQGVTNIADAATGRRTARIALDAPLTLVHAGIMPSVLNTVERYVIPPPGLAAALLAPASASGASVVFVNNRAGAFNVRADLVVVDEANVQAREVRRLGEPREATLGAGAPLGCAAGSVVSEVGLAPSNAIQVLAAPAPTVATFTVNDVSNVMPGQRVLAGGVPRTVSTVTVGAAPAGVLTVTPALGVVPAVGAAVVPVRLLQTPATRGAAFIALDNRLGLAVGDVLRIAAGANEEFVSIDALPDRAAPGVKPDAGNVLIGQILTLDYDVATTEIVQQIAPVAGSLQSTVAVLDVAAGGRALLLADGNGYAVIAPPGGRFVSVRTPEGEISYHRVAALGAVAAPMLVELDRAVQRAHPVGSPLMERVRLLDAEALDVGAWGDRLRLSVDRESTPLATTTLRSVIVSPTQIRVGSLTGVEPGTVLEMRTVDGTQAVGALLKVQTVDRATGVVTLQGTGLDFVQQAAIAAVPPGRTLGLASREFQLRVALLRQPDALMPARDRMVIQQEDFRSLSMDPRHSRYAPRLIGIIGGPLRRADHRPEGDSELIRMRDASNAAATQNSIRVGPEILIDVLPDGRTDRARHALQGGSDSIASLTDTNYIGQDDPNPELRTGLHTLRNVEEISIVSVPGNASPAMQNALINHCELLRYRFAVLDGAPPPRDSMRDIQAQRAQFDTKYAALYHPWLMIPHPYPTSPGAVPDYPIPPSGHMVGIYARTDIERGVHKAPANEVVRGVIGLQRLLNKEQHDILNPYPVNINVIRDFRPNNRGIRVYGGRCITSDSDWKYVNVRRLLIFIEASIDRGLQWVVFEPNAEPLWARVRRSISNFLTLVWRNGALEGTKPEEAFFVKCDRTTMTQTDIDQGRLICLVGVAPVKPAEFVIVRIGLWTAHADE